VIIYEYNVTLVTEADSTRPGLAFRIQFENEEEFQRWIALPEFAQALHEGFMGESVGAGVDPNSALVRHWDMHTNKFYLSMHLLTAILDKAYEMTKASGPSGAAGRPPARVLRLTTSRERRLDPRTRRGW